MPLLRCADCGTPYSDELGRCPNCQSPEVAPEPTRPMLPILHVECGNPVCPGSGVVRQVRLQPAGLGVLAAPSLLCAQCGHHVVTVRPWLPEEDQMAKITRHGGASDARAQDPADAPPRRDAQEQAAAEPAPTSPAAEPAPQVAAEPKATPPVPQQPAETETSDAPPAEPEAAKPAPKPRPRPRKRASSA